MSFFKDWFAEQFIIIFGLVALISLVTLAIQFLLFLLKDEYLKTSKLLTLER